MRGSGLGAVGEDTDDPVVRDGPERLRLVEDVWREAPATAGTVPSGSYTRVRGFSGSPGTP